MTVLLLGGIVAAGIFLTSLVPVNNESNSPKPQQKTEDVERVALQETLQQYLHFLSSTSDWWMVHTPSSNVEEARSLATELGKIKSALQSARNASPLTEEIYQNFNQFFTSTFFNGGSRVTMEGTIDMKELQGKTEVCFFSKSDDAREKIGGIVWYREDWRALMIAGIRWSSPHLSGLLYHELYHALQHRKGQSSTIASEKDIREEVDAHELEMVVFDYLTNGAYFKEAERVLLEHQEMRNERVLLGSVSTNVFFRLDRVLGLENTGADIRGTSVAQHLVTLGFKFIDRRGGTKEDKIALYRWIRKS